MNNKYMNNKHDNIKPILDDYLNALQRAKATRSQADEEYRQLKKDILAILDYGETVETESFTVERVARVRNMKPQPARVDRFDDLHIKYIGKGL